MAEYNPMDELLAKLSEDGNFEYLVEANTGDGSTRVAQGNAQSLHKVSFDRRLHARFKIQMEIIIFNQSSSFRTKTIDISRSGALLMETLPENFGNNVIDVVIINNKNIPGVPARVLLKAVLLGAVGARCRMSFHHSPQSSEFIEKILN